jgi:hypothetical protein
VVATVVIRDKYSLAMSYSSTQREDNGSLPENAASRNIGGYHERTSSRPFIDSWFLRGQRLSNLLIIRGMARYKTISVLAEGSVLEGYIPTRTVSMKEVDPMRKLLLSVSFLGLMLAGALAKTQPIPTAPQSGQQAQKATKSVAGTIAAVGDNGGEFDLEVNDGGTKEILEFVLDKDTQVQGQIKVGTSVTVKYVETADQNVVKTVTAQG